MKKIQENIKIVNCISSIDNLSAGTTYSVTRLVESCRIYAPNTELYSLSEIKRKFKNDDYNRYFKYDFAYIPMMKRLGVSKDLRLSLVKADADVYHIHGLWMLPNYYPALAAKALNRPLMLSPHGMLAPEAMRFSAVKKHAALALWQGRAFREVTCFRATCEAEYLELRAFGINAPIALIPNGVDIPSQLAGHKKSSRKTVLSLGRIHPKKGLDRLIEAWAQIERDEPEWSLNIVGPDENGHADDLNRLIRRLKLENVHIMPPVFGEQKMKMLAEAEIFVLSTLNENFAMTVAESLSCSTPVIATKGAPWAGLETTGSGWWVDHGPGPLAAALRNAMNLKTDERAAMGRRGREWMRRDFSWDRIASELLDVYLWMIGERPKPGCVRLD